MSDKESPKLKVVPFNSNESYPDTEWALENLLSKVKSGEVIGVAAVLVFRDKAIATTYTQGAGAQLFGCIGALEHLKHRMLEEAIFQADIDTIPK